MVAKSWILADDDNTLHAIECMREPGKIVIKLFFYKRNATALAARICASAVCHESHVKSICINHHAIHNVLSGFEAKKSQKIKSEFFKKDFFKVEFFIAEFF